MHTSEHNGPQIQLVKIKSWFHLLLCDHEQVILPIAQFFSSGKWRKLITTASGLILEYEYSDSSCASCLSSIVHDSFCQPQF